MKDILSRYTLRISPILLYKLGYIAEFEGRTKNKEIEQLIKKHIADFEKIHGDIDYECILKPSTE
jgi:predicted DNA-binding protein